jgi:hypothetical protein
VSYSLIYSFHSFFYIVLSVIESWFHALGVEPLEWAAYPNANEGLAEGVVGSVRGMTAADIRLEAGMFSFPSSPSSEATAHFWQDCVG